MAASIYYGPLLPGSADLLAGAGAQNVNVGLIDQTGVIYALDSLTRTKNVSVGLIDQTGTIYAVSVMALVSVPLIDQTGVIYALDSLTKGNVNVAVGLIDQTGVIYALSSLTKTKNVSVALIDQSGVIYALDSLTRTKNVSVGLIDQSGVVYAITVNQSAPMGTIDQSGVIYALTVNQAVALGLINQTGTMYAPGQVTQQVILGLIDQSGVLYGVSADLSGGPQNVPVGLVDQTGTMYALTQVSQTVPVSLVNQTGVLYAPTSTLAINAHTPRVVDLFNRADGSLGTADSGQAWSVNGFAISGNKVVPTSSGADVYAAVDVGTPEMEMVCDLNTGAATIDTGFIFRFIDNSNHLLAIVSDGACRFYKKVADAYTMLASATITNNASTTYTWTIRAYRDTLTLLRDGVPVLSHILSAADYATFASATKVGFRAWTLPSPTPWFDNLNVSGGLLHLVDQSGIIYAVTTTATKNFSIGLIDQTGEILAYQEITGGGEPPSVPWDDAPYRDGWITYTVCKNPLHEHYTKTIYRPYPTVVHPER